MERLMMSYLTVWGWLPRDWFSVLAVRKGEGREIEKREEWQSVGLCFGGRRRQRVGFAFIGF